MINLFNIDIKKIRYGGANIKLIKLGDTIIYEAPISYGVYEPYQFRDDTGLTEVDTIVNETHDNLSYMFYGCTKLAYTNANSWITNNVTDMSYMFCNCDSIKTLDLSNFDTRKVTNMDRMFHSCNSLTELDLSNFNTKRCREDSPTGNGIVWLMPNCNNLYTLRLDNCNRYTIQFILSHGSISHGNQYNPPEKIGTICCKKFAAEGIEPPYGWEFDYITEDPTELRLYNDITEEFRGGKMTEVRTIVNDSHTDLCDMFATCEELVSVNTEDWDTSNVTDMSYMFDSCQSLTSLDLSSWNTSKVNNMNYMFAFCSNLTSVNLSNFNINESTNMRDMFYNCTLLRKLRLDNCNAVTINKIINSEGFPTRAISGATRYIYCNRTVAEELTAPENWMFGYIYEYNEFAGNKEITTANVMVNTSHNDLGNMFNSCINLKSVNTEDWDTSNVINMMNMFNGCKSLVTLDLSSLNTSKVTNMNWMFYNCSTLETLDMRNFDTSNTTVNMRDMFYNCTSLRILRLDNCSVDTISDIISQSSFPTGTVSGETRKIYYKEADVSELTAPDGWEFVYID